MIAHRLKVMIRGQQFDHHWGRTLTEGDGVLFSTIAMRYCPLYFNVEYARSEGHRDIVKMMAGAMGDMAYYLVLAFAAAHFVAMFNWSNLGLIFAVEGADYLRRPRRRAEPAAA